MVKSYTPSAGINAVEYGFEILKSVDQGDYTKWSIIYDIRNMAVYFKTNESRKVKNISLADIDFECSSPVKMIDVNSDIEGNVNTQMTGYTYDANRKLIEDSYSKVDFLKTISNESKDKTAGYPEILTCMGKSNIDGNNKMNSPADFMKAPFLIAAGFLILSAVILYTIKNKKRV